MLTGSQTFYVESPEEQGKAEGEPLETLLRVFKNLDEAARYRAEVESYEGTSFEVIAVKLSDLSTIRCDKFAYPLRIEMCAMPEDEYPQEILCIYSKYEQKN